MSASSLRARISGEPLQAVRLLFLFFSVVASVGGFVRLVLLGASSDWAVAGSAAGLMLAAWWVHGFWRRRFPLLALPVEGALIVVACLAYGGPGPLFGWLYVSIAFRSFYGEDWRGLLPTATWTAAIVTGFIVTGSFTLQGNGFSGVQAPGVIVNGFLMWLLGWSLRERERSFNRERELLQAREVAAQEKAAALASLNLLKDRLIERVSHELRTPLSSIRSYSEMLLDYDDPDVRDEFVGIINSESARLSRLVDDVLDLAKIQADTFSFRMGEVDVAGILADGERSLRPRAAARGLNVVVDVTEDVGTIEGDRDRLLQVIGNLIENALKFTEQGEIVLTARRKEELVEVSVADSGVGVPENERDAIFERFHQARPAVAGQPQGTGLGLALCREIVARHGGRIEVAERPGGGSIFTVGLPALRQQPV